MEISITGTISTHQRKDVLSLTPRGGTIFYQVVKSSTQLGIRHTIDFNVNCTFQK